MHSIFHKITHTFSKFPNFAKCKAFENCSTWKKLMVKSEYFLSEAIFCNYYNHSVKSVRIGSFSVPYFAAFGLNTDQTNSEYGHFLRSEFLLVE